MIITLIVVLVFLVIGMIAIYYGSDLIMMQRRRFVKKTDQSIKRHYDHVDPNRPESIIDETPLAVVIGEERFQKLFLIRPLKYKQLFKIVSLFSKSWEKIKVIDFKDMEKSVEKIVSLADTEIIEAIAMILYMNENKDSNIDTKDIEKIKIMTAYIKNNISMNQFKRVLDVLLIQNDVKGISETITGHVKKKI